jgi:DNA repair exonuclease SbcCD ATPase subunit
LSQTAPNSDIQAQVDLFDQQIAYQQSIITDNKKTLSQLDSQLSKISDLATSGAGVTRSLKLRDSQRTDRAKLQTEINSAQTQINQLQAQKAPVSTKARKAEADVGPIKYIAQLIYGDKTNSDILERAVRWVIILIVCVFDPLAVVLAISASQLFEIAEQEKKEKLAAEAETISKTSDEINNIDTGIENKTEEPIQNLEDVYSSLDSQPEILQTMEKPIESTDSNSDQINNVEEEIDVGGVDIVHRIQKFLNQDGHGYK